MDQITDTNAVGNSRARRRLAAELLILAALGAALFLTNPAFTVIDDEAKIVSAAGAPLSQTLQTFRQGGNVHEHPPLYDVLLHIWLRLTHANFELLRLPAIIFYLLGIWLLSRAAEEIAGERAAWFAVCMGVLWPFGFHYGRIAAWYSFCFMIVAAFTLAYLCWVKRPGVLRWGEVMLLSVALVYTNYFGWAFLGCLALDAVTRRRKDRLRTAGLALASASLLAITYLPLWPSFADESSGVGVARGLAPDVLLGGFHLYSSFISESAAPWVWFLSVPALIFIAAVLLIMLFEAPWPARRFLLYALMLIAIMTVIGVISTKRLLPEAAWLLLAIAVTAGVLPRGRLRAIFFASLVGIFLIGWFGILARRYYSAPRFIEPWQQVSEEAATRSRADALIIGNNTSFFFYLAYALRSAGGPGSREMLGDFDAPIFGASDWIDEGKPLRGEIFFVRGAPGPLEQGPAWDAQTWLDAHCALVSAQQLMPDPGYALKAKFVPESGLPWRIQTRDYSCADALPGSPR